MAAHYRLAVPSAQVGQPEVKLGIIPGAAGTQRLPRLAGVAKAVEMCTEGKPVAAQEALQLGILDQLIEGDLLTGAVAFARSIVGKPVRRTRDLTAKLGAREQNAAFSLWHARPQRRSTAVLLRRSRLLTLLKLPPRCHLTKAAR